MELTLLQKSILATVAYYDILDYPLTGFEVFKYLINPLHIISLTESMQSVQLEPLGNISLVDVLKSLEDAPLKNFLDEKNGFYFLKSRRQLVEQRIERQKIAAPRWKKVYNVVKALQAIPFIKMIAVCNSLAINNSKADADIDFFIVIKQGRIWLTRLLITLMVWLKREWRHKDKIANKICLSFYITDDAMNLESIAIKPYDIYLANWVAQLRPIYCENQLYRDFIVKNLWVRNYLANFGKFPNYFHPEFGKNKFLSSSKIIKEKILQGFLGNITEKLLRFFQKNRIKRKLKPHKIPTAVVVSDKMLKFHENDKREFFQRTFIENFKKSQFS